jgi:hypothetical protein
MLKLQLASAENLAKQRLEQMQRLEAQVEAVKERRARQEMELAEQVTFLEEKLKESLARSSATTPVPENHDNCRAMMEEQARMAEEQRQRDVQSAMAKARAQEQRAKEQLVRAAQSQRRVVGAAYDAAGQWEKVRDMVGDVLDALRSGKCTLSVLKADLDLCEARIRSRAA